MPNGERIVTHHENGSMTITRRHWETVPASEPYSSGDKLVPVETSVHRLPKAKDIIPNVPSRIKRLELVEARLTSERNRIHTLTAQIEQGERIGADASTYKQELDAVKRSMPYGGRVHRNALTRIRSRQS